MRWIFVVVWVSVLACGDLSARADSKGGDRFSKARALTKQGKYAEAVAQYEAILKQRPKDKRALNRVGPLYFLTGQWESARWRFAKVTRALPTYARGWYYYAYALRKLGRYQPALAAYRSYRKLAPQDPHPFYGMAQCHQELGELGKAAAAYEKFIRRAATLTKRRDLSAWILRARTEARQLRGKLGAERSSAAVKRILLEVKRAFSDGDPILAEKLLKAGVQKHRSDPQLVNALAGLLVNARRFNEALPILRRALRRKDALPGMRYKLALCLRENGDLAGAARAYKAFLQLRPKNPDAHYGLAETLRKLGKLRAALGLYEQYVVLEQRAAEQHWVTKAREQIVVLKKQLAQAPTGPATRPVSARPGASAPSGPSALTGVTDPQIRALLEARQRFLKRQQGADVGEGPRPAARPPGTRPAGESRRERRRRLAEERRRKREDARRQREEARRQRLEEVRRRREARLAKVRRRKAEAEAKRVLAGRTDRLGDSERGILLEWADAASGKGDHRRAFSIWRRLAELKPGDLATQQKLAQAATAAGEHRAAVTAYRALLKANPKQLDLYGKLRAAEAKAGMRQTPLPLRLILAPEIVAGRKALGAFQAARARNLARQRLKANPNDAYALVLEADALLQLRLLPGALSIARKAARLRPDLAGPHRIIGSYHLKRRDRGAALREFRQWLQKVGKDPSEAPYRAYIKSVVKRLSW